MSPAGLRRTHFVLRSSGEEGQEVLRLSTRVGGLSGVLGEAEEGDDAEANASAELSLLGLPLRPFTLFSSMGEDISYSHKKCDSELIVLHATCWTVPPTSQDVLVDNVIKVS